jgi:hypothetical protein
MKWLRILIIPLIFLSFVKLYSQNTTVLYGKVLDEKGLPLQHVSIAVFGDVYKTVTDESGYYELTLPAQKNISVFFTYVGCNTDTLLLFLQPNEKKEYNTAMLLSTTIFQPLDVKDNKNVSNTLVKIDRRNAFVIPTLGGGIEALLKTLPGVASNNELSSQYSVRGGNFDENLVYVNDIEIYRPFLVRSGQQEGLSFVNSDLVSDIQFSAGGFEAKYGDKMSSVLDIQYNKPKEFAGSVSGSLLGYSAHVEGISENTRLTYLLGVRQKSNSYLLKSLETKGDYKPSFTDVQTNINYMVNEKLDIDFLGNYARNVYKVIPQTRETDFGTLNDALRLTIYFDGQEVDRFMTYFGAFSANYKPRKDVKLKFITSAFQTSESETFDTQGEYWLDQLETNMGGDEFGNSAFNMGVGTFLNHARNYLNASVFNFEHKGTQIGKKLIQYWGAKYQKEIIDDYISEWKMLDSAGYSLPYYHDSVGYIDPTVQPYLPLEMQDVVKAENSLSSNRYTGYYEQKWIFENDSTTFSFTAGIRGNYWDLNEQFVASPRATFSYKPNWKHDVIFRFSSGYYNQPPFYRELRDMEGVIHKDVKAQTSIHFLLSGTWNFTAWDRPFKYTSEVYYKILDNLIPYDVDNVRIRYFANNSSHGFATGIDMKVNGEFVKGIESWASLSVMRTMEDIKNDFYYEYFNKSGELIIPGYTYDQTAVDSVRHEPGYIPRPTDQRVTFGLFFQDYLPKNPTYKMHLSLLFGSSLPFGPPTYDKYKDTLRIPPYRRVDIGFSKQLKGKESKLKPKNPFRFFKTIWLSLEVFNLLQVNNTISYIWVKDVSNRQYAVPNYLTPRQLNIRIIAEF